MKILIEVHYFPSLEYFSLLKKSSEIWFEAKANFIKQTYHNRCHILTSHGQLSLAIPLLGGNKKIPIDKIKIDYNQRWLHSHWRSIISAYNRSPYFEYYKDDIHDILYKKYDTLFELNNEILTFCLKATSINVPVFYTESYEPTPINDLADFRSIIHPKKTYTHRNHYQSKQYHQLFGRKFVANLSILDLISNEGPNSGIYL